MQRQGPAFTVEGYLDGVRTFADSANRAEGGRRLGGRGAGRAAAGRGRLRRVGRAAVRRGHLAVSCEAVLVRVMEQPHRDRREGRQVRRRVARRADPRRVPGAAPGRHRAPVRRRVHRHEDRGRLRLPRLRRGAVPQRRQVRVALRLAVVLHPAGGRRRDRAGGHLAWACAAWRWSARTATATSATCSRARATTRRPTCGTASTRSRCGWCPTPTGLTAAAVADAHMWHAELFDRRRAIIRRRGGLACTADTCDNGSASGWHGAVQVRLWCQQTELRRTCRAGGVLHDRASGSTAPGTTCAVHRRVVQARGAGRPSCHAGLVAAIHRRAPPTAPRTDPGPLVGRRVRRADLTDITDGLVRRTACPSATGRWRGRTPARGFRPIAAARRSAAGRARSRADTPAPTRSSAERTRAVG